MTDVKLISEREIWIIMKAYFGGRVEFTDAYWNENEARAAASQQLPTSGNTFTISIHSIKLHGRMAVEVDYPRQHYKSPMGI